jgi:hypothetical protein
MEDISQHIKDRQNLIRNNIGDSISKGSFSDEFRYNSNAIPISKTGKEIKVKLEDVKRGSINRCNDLANEMKDLLAKCSTVPTEEPSTYEFQKMKSKFDVIPKMFSFKHEEMNVPEGSMDQPKQMSSEEKAQRECCHMYNEMVYSYISAKIDTYVIETMIDGLKDSRNYDLTITQATDLGF